MRPPVSVEPILEALGATPGRLAEVTTGLSESVLQTAPKPGEWSANEVLAHLRACSDVWGGNIGLIVGGDRPTFRAVNPRSFIRQTDYCDLDFATSFDAFAKQRTELLTLLESLSGEGWSRVAVVTGGGPPRERTVFFYAEWLARHERPHVRQIERAIAASRA